MRRVVTIVVSVLAVSAGTFATAQSLGLPDNPKQGGVWIMNAGTSTAHLMTPGS
jgi:hypothetical protein